MPPAPFGTRFKTRRKTRGMIRILMNDAEDKEEKNRPQFMDRHEAPSLDKGGAWMAPHLSAKCTDVSGAFAALRRMAIDTHTSPVSSRMRPFSFIALTDLEESIPRFSASRR